MRLLKIDINYESELNLKCLIKLPKAKRDKCVTMFSHTRRSVENEGT